MRAFALALAVAYFLANLGAALFMYFLAAFPFENQSPEDQAADDWMIGVGILVALLALVVLIAVVLRRQGWATIVYAPSAVIGFALLKWAVGVSDHSDGKLIVWVVAIQATGLGAVVLSARRSGSLS